MKTGTEQQNNRLLEVLWRQTLVVMVMISLSKMGATMVDSVIMARVFGPVSTAAMGIVAPFATFVSLIGGLISTGCQSICSAAYAKGDTKASSTVFVTSFYITVAVTAVVTVGAYLFSEPISEFLGARGENAYLLPETSAYLRGVSIGAPAMALNLLLAPIVHLYGGGTCVNRSIFLLFVFDVIFDILAVVLGLGSWGIGFSTALSNYLCALNLLLFLASRKVNISFSPAFFNPKSIHPILKRGAPEAVKRFLRMVGDIFTNLIILLTAAGAAMTGKTLGTLLTCLFTTLGLAAASSAYLLSGAYAAIRDEEGLLALGRKQLLHLLITTVLTVLGIIFTPLLVDLILKADAETKRISVVCIRCMLLSMPSYVASEMVVSYLQSIGRLKSANAISVLGQTLIYIPLVALLGMRRGAVGVLLSSPIALTLTLAVFYAGLSVKLRRPARLRDILHISECIHPDEIDVAARTTVQNMNDAVRCSEEVRSALLERGSDQRTALAVSLFVEEICSNIIEHGFRKTDVKRKLFMPTDLYAVVFAFVSEETVTLRVYDNCVLFDPAEKLKRLEESGKGPESGLGLKLVFSMADEASYTSLLNMNHMLIRISMHSDGAPRDAEPKELVCLDERYLPRV